MIIKIETYWNVNKQAHKQLYKLHFIKIETYWNVNEQTETHISICEIH